MDSIPSPQVASNVGEPAVDLSSEKSIGFFCSIKHQTPHQAAALADFAAIGQRIFVSEEWAEGVRSFVDKRKAVFKGR